MSSVRNTKTSKESDNSSRLIKTETGLGPATMLVPVWPQFPKEVTAENLHKLSVEELKKYGFVKEVSGAIELGIFYDHWHHPGAPIHLAWTRRQTDETKTEAAA